MCLPPRSGGGATVSKSTTARNHLRGWPRRESPDRRLIDSCPPPSIRLIPEHTMRIAAPPDTVPEAANEIRMSEDVHRPLRPSDRGELRRDDGGVAQLRKMRRGDRDAVLDFFRSLEADSPSLPVDIDNADQLERWIADIERGYTTAILACTGSRVIAYI